MSDARNSDSDATPQAKSPADEGNETSSNPLDLVWQLTVEEWKRRGLEIPEFDRTKSGKIRLQDDV